MKHSSSLGLLLGCLAGPALAAESIPPASQLIPVYSVSPGTSGSVSSTVRNQRYDVVGGRLVPEGGYPSEYGSRMGSSSVQQRGGIRQSIEYPGGRRIELQPGQGSYQIEGQRQKP